MQRKQIFLLVAILFSITSFSQTLFTYGNKTVTKEEFIKAFNRNPDTTGNRKEKAREYLDMYINFKLKLQAAYDEKLNDDPAIFQEAENFKMQLAENLVNEQANINQLVHEAFLRSQKNIKVAQVFVEVAPGEDTAAAYLRINQALKAIEKGNKFEEVSAEYSTDSLVKSMGGRIGYITAFILPYKMENIVYGLAPGQHSSIYHSSIGYHIFKNLEERPAMGTRRIQHLMFLTPDFYSDTEKQQVAKRTDSIYDLLKKGASFNAILEQVGQVENHDFTPINVEVGKYNQDFEQQVFSLKTPGDISVPFATSYGYNIIKLVDTLPVVKDEEDIINISKLQEVILNDSRLNVAKKKLAEQWLKDVKYNPSTYNKEDLKIYTDSILNGNDPATGYKSIKPSTILFAFEKQKYTVEDWIRFLNNNEEALEGNVTSAFDRLMNMFLTNEAASYYKAHIEDFYPAVKDQIIEFNDANMLFAFMKANIWDKATEDEAALKKYYQQHKNRYIWQPSVNALVVTGSDEETVKAVAAQVKANPSDWQNIISKYAERNIDADSSRYEFSQLQMSDSLQFTEGYQTSPSFNEQGDSYTFIHIFKVHREQGPREFDEAQGMVINDYQQVIENEWLEKLKKKYPVKINEAVFNTIQ